MKEERKTDTIVEVYFRLLSQREYRNYVLYLENINEHIYNNLFITQYNIIR